MAYLLDANVFIQAKNLHYGFDFCPAFWDWLEQQNAAGAVFSVERVGDELTAGEDRLADWAERRGRSLFLPPDSAMLGSLPTVAAWVSSQNYSPAAVNMFLQVADYYLVACALAHADVVVTHEVAADFEDLGIANPEEALAKARLADAIADIIEEGGLTQVEGERP